MSVNYGHSVDVPVTNLDDDDDILFHEQNDLNSLFDMDYDPSQSQPTGIGLKFGQKLKAWFMPSYKPIESYELQNASSFDIDRDSAGIAEDLSQPFDLKQRFSLVRNNLAGVFIMIPIMVLIVVVVLIQLPARGQLVNLSKMVLSNSTHSFHPTTIVVSLDGFHPHYINADITPTLHQMMVHDYGAPYIVPSFPSSTFPNHWTLVTGLYPSEHGIVGNTFYDPHLNKQFVNTNAKKGLDPDFWQGGEPVWKTAHKQGFNSAIHMWPGSEVPGVGIDGGPLHVDRFNGSEVLSTKVNRVMTWLDTEDINFRPELILTYVPTIDQFGHQFGITGSNLTQALSYVDDFVKLLKLELLTRNLQNIANLIIVSDHGMAPTSNDRLLYVDDLIDMNMIEHVDGWPLFGLRPYNKYSTDLVLEKLFDKFNKLDENTKNNFDIYKTNDLPPEWNFGGTQNHKFDYRLAPIWIIPKVGYVITTHKQMDEYNNDYQPKGVHGYNNTELLMRALFLGSGPYFDSQLSTNNKKVLPFNNTEVYNLICHSLHVTPAPNNGTFGNGYTISAINGSNALPSHWTDPLEFPDLGFETPHVVNNSTYDMLWKPKPDEVTKPQESVESEVPHSSTVNSDPTKAQGFLDNFLDKIEDIGDDLNKGIDNTGQSIDDGIDHLAEDIEEGVEDLDEYFKSFVNGDNNDDST